MILADNVVLKGLQFREYLENCRTNGIKPEKTWEDVIVEIGCEIAAETFRKKIGAIWNNRNKEDRANENIVDAIDSNHVSISNYKESVEIKSDGTQISDKLIQMTAEQSKDKNFLLKSHGFDEKVWEIQNAKSSIWNMYSKLNGKMEMYSSKITVKPRIGNQLLQAEYENICQRVMNKSEKTYVPKKYEFGTEALEICLFDVHFAKLAHQSETGNTYDYKIAKERFLNCIKKYIDKYKGRKFEKIIFPIGNDFWNSEATGNTTHDTRQDNDTRYSVMFEKGLETLIEGIEMLSDIAPVDVILVQGNHDFYVSFYGAVALKYRFEKDPNVFINAEPKTRKYVSFGECLIGYSHGSEEKDRIYGLMQTEVPELWGKSKVREWHLGHLHSEHTICEKNGVIARNISSVVNTDQWHYLKGYVGAVKKSMAFVWDKTDGLQEINFVNIWNDKNGK